MQTNGNEKSYFEESNREFAVNFPNEIGIEVKYKKLVKIWETYDGQEDILLKELEEHCPTSVTRFIELFATLFGVHTSAYLAVELLMKGLK